MTAPNWQDEFLAAVLSPEPALSAGMRIYQLNRLAMASRALTLVFPVTQQLLGAAFESAVQKFIRQHTPASADWAQLGQDFPHWLQQQAELHCFAYVPAMAWLEWQYFVLQSAADLTPDFDSYQLLEQYATDALSVAVHPHAVLIQSGFPLSAIWQYHQQPPDPALLPEIQRALNTTDFVDYILLTRQQFKVELIRLTAVEHDLFRLCRTGDSLTEVLQVLAREGLDFTLWLTRMLQVGAVTGFALRPA